MKISINITTWNRKKLTEFCINSLIRTTKRDQFNLVVVDNFSTDGTVEMLKEMKNKKIIDTLILNSKNLHLGKAVNQAWDAAAKDVDWLLWCNNDFFFMDKWLDNFTLVVNDLNIDYVNCIYLEGLVRNKVARGIPKKTKNGGSYLEQTLRKKKKYVTATGPILKKALRDKYNIRVSEVPFSEGRTGPSNSFYSALHRHKLRGVRLNKPCILLQDSDYNNPLYKNYYEKTFKERDIQHVLRFYKNRGRFKNIKKYYEGTTYLEDIKKGK